MKLRVPKIYFGPIWKTKMYLSVNGNSVELGKEAFFLRTHCRSVFNIGYSIR